MFNVLSRKMMEGLREPLINRNFENDGYDRAELNPISVERESLVTEAKFKLNACLIGAVLGFIICVLYYDMQLCSKQMIIWFLLFAIFSVFHCVFLASYIYSTNITSLVYTVSNYPLDLVTIGLFIYGMIIYSNLTEACSLEYPFPYYMMLIVLIIQLSTFLKYIACVILLILCTPLIAYILIREYMNRPQPEQSWEEFENDVFEELEHKTLVSEIQQNYESCCICLIEFEKEDKIVILPCNDSHHFHKNCIREWLRRQRNCPLCKQTVEI
ncbi:unnamed protein product [Moneuplotes crassus]|uniref:RING-type domain-containing protein n=1 Tax=Euplotes crassus TaxID=5936 RepID=A0AAD2D212_EUPCR|nr:unnamed protein product [Moneuplotes crassus]